MMQTVGVILLIAWAALLWAWASAVDKGRSRS